MFVFFINCILITSKLLILRQIQAHVQNASNIAAAIHKFLGGVDEDTGVLHEIHSDESHMKQQVMPFSSLAISWVSHFFFQMLNIEIFKAPRVGLVNVYECLAVDVAAMTVTIPFSLLAQFHAISVAHFIQSITHLTMCRCAFLTNFLCFYTTLSSKRKRKRFYR